MTTHTQNRGFTLIELLVVIAIIGILASVVLASLNTARDKGTNAGIVSNINSTRAQAAIYYEDAGNVYEITDGVDSVCVNDATVTPIGIAHLIVAADALNPSVGDTLCNDDPTSWAVAAQLVGDDSGNYTCMDSTGASKEITGVVGTDFTTELVCP